MNLEDPLVLTPYREMARWRRLFRISLGANFALAAALVWALRR